MPAPSASSFPIYPGWGMRRPSAWRMRWCDIWSDLKLSDRSSNETGNEADSNTEPGTVEFFDPWDRQLSFERQSSLLSPVGRDEPGKGD